MTWKDTHFIRTCVFLVSERFLDVWSVFLVKIWYWYFAGECLFTFQRSLYIDRIYHCKGYSQRLYTCKQPQTCITLCFTCVICFEVPIYWYWKLYFRLVCAHRKSHMLDTVWYIDTVSSEMYSLGIEAPKGIWSQTTKCLIILIHFRWT